MAGRRVAVTVKSDALDRAAHTLWQGVGVDAVAMVGLGLTELLSTTEITTGAFWTAFGLLIGKSVLTAAATYMVRLKRPAATAKGAVE